MNIVIIQARMSSTRLPGKVLKELAGKPVLEHMIRKAGKIVGIDRVVVATSDQASDDPVATWCEQQKVDCYRGNLNNVLARFISAAEEYKADNIMRLTADCPLFDPNVSSQILALFQATGADYCSNVNPQSWPDGLDCEVFSLEAIKEAQEQASGEDLEHVTTFIRRNQSRFKVANLRCPLPHLYDYRWTMDTPEDYEFLQKLFDVLPEDFGYLDVLDILEKTPVLKEWNEKQRSRQRTPFSSQERHFQRSKDFLKVVEEVIPLASQTFSKSKLNFNPGHAPLFATHGQDGRIWDIDGNAYVDMIMGLLPVSMGYNDPDVDFAIREQLDRGISFSLATELEYELSKRIVDIIPCAEQVRFGKNGTDATSAAVRLARAYTGKDHILVCGYHGWQDWYIGSTARHLGVPQATRDLTTAVPYNDLNALETVLKEKKGQVAGLILEPANFFPPQEGYLEQLKDLLHTHNALLIFDEVITGFRFSLGGAQEYFGVTPDLASFGKSMANGMPLSVITGRTDIMDKMNDIFFSGTFGGEALSLAAGIAVIDKMRREPVIETMWSTGAKIKEGVEAVFKQYGLEDQLALIGYSPLHLLQIKEKEPASAGAIKTFILHELYKEGVLSLGTHNICYAHTDKDVEHVVNSYGKVIEKLSHYTSKQELLEAMDYPEITPVFQVRKNG